METGQWDHVCVPGGLMAQLGAQLCSQGTYLCSFSIRSMDVLRESSSLEI